MPINRVKHSQTPSTCVGVLLTDRRNIIAEETSTYGATSTDRDIGKNIDAAKGASSGKLDGASVMKKAERRTEEGMKVGADGDQHDLAASKQP